MGRWSLVYPARLHWKRFDQAWVVYEEASNQTLVVDALEIDLLICLSDAPIEADLLEKQVLNDLQVQDNSEARLMVNSGLARLKSVGLIKHMQDAPIPNQS